MLVGNLHDVYSIDFAIPRRWEKATEGARGYITFSYSDIFENKNNWLMVPAYCVDLKEDSTEYKIYTCACNRGSYKAFCSSENSEKENNLYHDIWNIMYYHPNGIRFSIEKMHKLKVIDKKTFFVERFDDNKEMDKVFFELFELTTIKEW